MAKPRQNVDTPPTPKVQPEQQQQQIESAEARAARMTREELESALADAMAQAAMANPQQQAVAVREQFTPDMVTQVNGAHLYRPGDKLPNGNECRQTVLVIPTLKELKAKPGYEGKSADDLKEEIADIGRASKPVASAIFNAAIADNSFIMRRLAINKSPKTGLHTLNLSVKQVDSEDLVEKLARIHGKNPADVRKALGLPELTAGK